VGVNGPSGRLGHRGLANPPIHRNDAQLYLDNRNIDRRNDANCPVQLISAAGAFH
jgi:hypothetical protein